MKFTLEELNRLSPLEFHKLFENVVEHWPEAAIYCSAIMPCKNVETILNTFSRYLDQMTVENKLKILRLHPDLAGKFLDENTLTIESTSEQQSAGLHKLTDADKIKIKDLNKRWVKPEYCC